MEVHRVQNVQQTQDLPGSIIESLQSKRVFALFILDEFHPSIIVHGIDLAGPEIQHLMDVLFVQPIQQLVEPAFKLQAPRLVYQLAAA
ncbi:hypothetical protein D3C81_1862840 [compost metagenome]